MAYSRTWLVSVSEPSCSCLAALEQRIYCFVEFSNRLKSRIPKRDSSKNRAAMMQAVTRLQMLND